jgi:hypothetical protein
MTQPEVLKLTNRVWFEQYPGCVMTLEYIERQSDPYYTDNQESVDIDSDLAKRIVAFLAKVPQVERRVHSAEHHVAIPCKMCGHTFGSCTCEWNLDMKQWRTVMGRRRADWAKEK